jgi:hypothetical protein
MRVTRRNFLQTAGSAAALFVAGGSTFSVFGQSKTKEGLFELPAEVYSNPVFSMSAKEFEQMTGRTFTVVGENGKAVELVLMEVNRLERQPNVLRGYYGESYSLVFVSPRDERIVQDNYELSADGLKSFSALIVPTSRGEREYEIIVNRITR